MLITALSMKTTGFSQFFLLHGWSPVLSINNLFFFYFVQDKEDNNRTSFTNPWREQLKGACEIAMMNSRRGEGFLQ